MPPASAARQRVSARSKPMGPCSLSIHMASKPIWAARETSKGEALLTVTARMRRAWLFWSRKTSSVVSMGVSSWWDGLFEGLVRTNKGNWYGGV